MDENELLYRLALSNLPGVGPVYAKRLHDHCGSARAVFHTKVAHLSKIKGIGRARADLIARFHHFSDLEKELAFIEKHGIKCLFYADKDYPQRLLRFKEAPILLFYMGAADLNSRRILAVIGTRDASEYGKQMTERLIGDLVSYEPIIISGLAWGIDTAAHKAAIRHSLPTIGVLGHGLDRIYPAGNRPLAREMLKQGGLLTHFNISTEPAAYHFPLRNQTVAGICDTLVVVETEPDGGSMLTVKNALNFKKKVFAIPGRISDRNSSGCNQLIREGHAHLLSHASQLAAEMDWSEPGGCHAKQGDIFSSEIETALSAQEQMIFGFLKGNEKMSIDQIAAQTRLSPSAIAMALLKLEFQGIVAPLPGQMYRLAV
jgi:DNA processing protein